MEELIKSELEILREAQESEQNPMTVLTKLNITTHVYALFVYERILLANKDTVENILNALKIADSFENLTAINNLKMGNVKNRDEQIQKLKNSGIKYLDEFLARPGIY